MVTGLLVVFLADHQRGWYVVSIVVKPAALGRFERKLAAELRRTRIRRQLGRAGKQIEGMLRAGSQGVYDQGGYSGGWRAVTQGTSLVVTNTADHFIFVEKGRKPGAQPPRGAVLGWVLRKGMHADAAFPVARAIGRRGVRPRPFFVLPSIQDAMVRIVQRRLIRWFDPALLRAAG
jgi:hypothetical protein